MLNAVLVIALCVICCINGRRREKENREIGKTPSLYIVARKLMHTAHMYSLILPCVSENNLVSSPSSHNVPLGVTDLAPHNVSTFQPARKLAQNHDMGKLLKTSNAYVK